MEKESLLQKLSLLGYSIEWIEQGLLTEELLNKQIEELKKDEEEKNIVDDSTEHYRNAAFYHFIENRNIITDAEIEALIIVANTESEDLYKGAISSLLEKNYLTDKQFEKLATYLLSRSEFNSSKIITRKRLLRKLRNEPLTPELFETCLNEGDGFVHTILIDIVKNDKEKLKQLAKKGSNKKNRNMAQQLYYKKS